MDTSKAYEPATRQELQFARRLSRERMQTVLAAPSAIVGAQLAGLRVSEAEILRRFLPVEPDFQIAA